MAFPPNLLRGRSVSSSKEPTGGLRLRDECGERQLGDRVRQALEENGRGEIVARNARKYYEDHYSRPIYEEKLRQVLKVLNSCAA